MASSIRVYTSNKQEIVLLASEKAQALDLDDTVVKVFLTQKQARKLARAIKVLANGLGGRDVFCDQDLD